MTYILILITIVIFDSMLSKFFCISNEFLTLSFNFHANTAINTISSIANWLCNSAQLLYTVAALHSGTLSPWFAIFCKCTLNFSVNNGFVFRAHSYPWCLRWRNSFSPMKHHCTSNVPGASDSTTIVKRTSQRNRITPESVNTSQMFTVSGCTFLFTEYINIIYLLLIMTDFLPLSLNTSDHHSSAFRVKLNHKSNTFSVTTADTQFVFAWLNALSAH